MRVSETHLPGRISTLEIDKKPSGGGTDISKSSTNEQPWRFQLGYWESGYQCRPKIFFSNATWGFRQLVQGPGGCWVVISGEHHLSPLSPNKRCEQPDETRISLTTALQGLQPRKGQPCICTRAGGNSKTQSFFLVNLYLCFVLVLR